MKKQNLQGHLEGSKKMFRDANGCRTITIVVDGNLALPIQVAKMNDLLSEEMKKFAKANKVRPDKVKAELHSMRTIPPKIDHGERTCVYDLSVEVEKDKL